LKRTRNWTEEEKKRSQGVTGPFIMQNDGTIDSERKCSLQLIGPDSISAGQKKKITEIRLLSAFGGLPLLETSLALQPGESLVYGNLEKGATPKSLGATIFAHG
jgi:hypothetical protein